MISLLFVFFAALPPNQKALEEMRITLMDLQRSQSAQQMEIKFLQEEVEKLKKEKGAQGQEKLASDLKELKNHANQTTQSLVEYKNQILAIERDLQIQNEKLQEVVRLKGTLSSISKAMGMGGKIYKVQTNDTLEKIARKYNTTVEELQQLNGLSSTTIMLGQDLKIP